MLVSALLVSACGQRTAPYAPANEVETSPLPVSVFELRPQIWHQTIQTFGRLVSAEKVTIGVEVAGTVAEVRFKEGQTVKAGQTLLVLDDRKQRLRLERASADVASARAELNRSLGTFQRYRALRSRQVIAEEAYKQTEAAYKAARASLKQAVAERALVRQELRDLNLVSPVDGVVESESVEPGQRVQPGQQLALLQTVNSLQVITYVREQEVNLLKPGDLAPVESPGAPGRAYQARIESVASAADPRTGNFAIKLRVDNADGMLRDGMSATIELRSQAGELLLMVPRAAVTDRNRRRVVFVLREGRAQRIAPVLGLGVGDQIPVRSGLESGDQLIIEPLSLVTDQKAVVAVPVDRQAAELQKL